MFVITTEMLCGDRIHWQIIFATTLWENNKIKVHVWQTSNAELFSIIEEAKEFLEENFDELRNENTITDLHIQKIALIPMEEV